MPSGRLPKPGNRKLSEDRLFRLDPVDLQLPGKDLLERLLLCLYPPDLQLAVPPGHHLEMDRTPVGTGEADMPDEGRMAPVKTLAQTDEGREDPERVAPPAVEIHNLGILPPGSPFPVEAGDVCHEGDLVLVETQQFGIPDDVVGMGVMVGIGDERTAPVPLPSRRVRGQGW